MTTRVFDCAKCGAPVSFLSAFCPYCRAPLTWSDVPHLGRGAPIVQRDYARETVATPEIVRTKGRLEPGAGVWFDIAKNQSPRGKVSPALADVAASVTAMVPGEGGFGLMARAHEANPALVCYAMRVRPWRRDYTFVRLASAAGAVHIDRIRPWETVSLVRPPGQLNTVELRCADSIFNLFINDAHVATVVDARFGFGEVYWETSAYDNPARVLLLSASVHAIA